MIKTLTNKKAAIRIGHLTVLLLSLALFSCNKEDIIGDDPYAGGKQPLGIRFENTLPNPELAVQGGEVTVYVRGLTKFKDKFKLYVNQIEANVLTYTDSTALIKVPDNASTGGLSVVAEQQTFFGPVLKIDGRVSIDQTFRGSTASYRNSDGSVGTGAIADFVTLPSGNSFLVGGFNNFDNRWTEKIPIGAIAQIDAGGAYVTPGAVNFGKGANGSLSTITRLTSGLHNGKFLVTGFFSSFNSTRTNRLNISSVTRLNANGTLDSTIIDVINPTPNEVGKNRDTVPSFNGGVLGNVVKSFVFGNRLYLIGNFENYVRRFYDRSTYDTKVLDIIKMRQMASLKINETDPTKEGDLDLTFHYDINTKQSPMAGNGSIRDAVQLPDGKIILVGSFTSFNGQPANRIVRINLDGSVDATFNTAGGADAEISNVTYNVNTGKILVAGLFKSFGGNAKQGVAMLNADGTLTTTFNFGTVTEGIPTFAAQLNSGKVIVSGSFKTYNNVVRQGFMILNADGTLASGYNNTGQFNGQILKMSEVTTGLITKVTLVGRISMFDNTNFGGIVRLNLRN